ncbi:hypothetical protein P8C59_007713 [Phyllachora maydis]|uniref:SnoaL-like domain-containing protein n=1 Tax=Phyllachora maydis TaxID=1825666 RepID=A0AAD9MHA8_9PEZI|nr:hypothetical protein P8C59_007713 [Phyllachora maydis]
MDDRTAQFSKTDFLDYCRAFNRRDYAAMASYYTADVALTLPDPAAPALHGRGAVVEYYERLHATADETVVPVVLMADAARMFYVMDAYVRCKRAAACLLGYDDVGVGDVVMMRIWALYELSDEGRIARIECRLVKRALLGTVDLEERLEESRRAADPGLEL